MPATKTKQKIDLNKRRRMGTPLDIETDPIKIKRINDTLDEIRSIDLKLYEKK